MKPACSADARWRIGKMRATQTIQLGANRSTHRMSSRAGASDASNCAERRSGQGRRRMGFGSTAADPPDRLCPLLPAAWGNA